MKTLVLSPQPSSTSKHQSSKKRVNPFTLERGLLYPRWLVLSVMLDSLVGILLRVVTNTRACNSPTPLQNLYCTADSRTFAVQCLLIGVLFVLGYLCLFYVGYRFFKKFKTMNFLNAISAIDTVQWLFLILALPVIFAILFSYFSTGIAAFPCMLAIILILIAIWTPIYRSLEKHLDEKLNEKLSTPTMRQRKQSTPEISVATYPRKEPPTSPPQQ